MSNDGKTPPPANQPPAPARGRKDKDKKQRDHSVVRATKAEDGTEVITYDIAGTKFNADSLLEVTRDAFSVASEDADTVKSMDDRQREIVDAHLRKAVAEKYPQLNLSDDSNWASAFIQILARFAKRQSVIPKVFFPHDTFTIRVGAGENRKEQRVEDEVLFKAILDATNVYKYNNGVRRYLRCYSKLWIELVTKTPRDDGPGVNESLAAKFGIPAEYDLLTPDWVEPDGTFTDDQREAWRIKVNTANLSKNKGAERSKIVSTLQISGTY
ncbi:putative coat protein [Persimmon virus B]|uniref:Putative coat protein n=1 Tax=Persimmon virus B TaxID=1493829 RepID=A0A0A8JEL7_9CLOS|nr:putative coat protein [Persimmon virus B]BAQ08210.1 putative coat protein [Persimmon virus B]